MTAARKTPARLWPVLWRAAASAGGGALAASAFPPVAGAEAAWVAFVPLLILARFTGPRPAFRWGFLSGLCFWLPSLGWLLRLCDTGGPWPLVTLGWLLLAAYCALYTGAFVMAVSGLFRRAGASGAAAATSLPASAALLLAVPIVWVGLEYLRSTLFTGFPWNGLGVSQFRNLAVIQVAEWGGVYAVSAAIMAMNAALALTVLRCFAVRGGQGLGARLHPELLAGLAVCAFCWMHGARTVLRHRREASGDPVVRIAAVQPNILQLKKWPEGGEAEIYDTLARQTRLAATGRPDVIVWPETAVPAVLPDDPEARSLIADLASDGVLLLIGAMESAGDGRELYNSSFLFGTDGRILQVYRKRHLVPFGEYVPLETLVPALSSLAPLGYSCAAGRSTTVFRLRAAPPGADPSVGRRADGIGWATLICFEDIMAPLARDAALAGAQFLVNQTNDAWFDGSAGSLQHLSHCVFRCVETGLPAVRAANTGVTCFIDRTGRIEDATVLAADNWGRGREGFWASGLAVPPAGRSPTVYVRFGDRVFALPCAVLALAALAGAARTARAPCRVGGEG